MFQRLTACSWQGWLERQYRDWHEPQLWGKGMNSNGGTGFSREGVGGHTADLRVRKPASSRLKPVPLKALRVPSEAG